MHVFGPQAAQGLREEGRLQERLSAGKGHPAAGLVEEDPVPEQPLHQRRRLQLLPDPLQGAGGAGLQVGVARDPAAPRQLLLAAVAAGHTAVLHAHDGRLGRLALRVVAPEAGQRAALHEHGAPQSGAILEGEALDVEDRTLTHSSPRDWLAQ